MAGALLFVTVFMVEGFLRPGYDPVSMFVSELSRGPRGGIQIASFVVSGALLLLFARGVAAELKAGRASRAGPILLAIISISLLVSGPLVMDPAATPRELMTLNSRLHWAFGALVFSLAPVSCWVFWFRFRRDPDWQGFQGWTLLAAMATTVAVVLFSAGPTRPPAAPNDFNAYTGLIQRSLLVPYLIWIFAFAWRLRRRAGRAA